MSLNWNKLPTTYISAEEMNNLIDELHASNLKEIKFYCCKRFEAAYMTYCIATNKTDVCVRICKGVKDAKQFTFSCTDTGHNRAGQSITGTQAYDYVEKIFKEDYPRLTLFRAFSGMEYEKKYREIKKCVPKQISMVSQSALGFKIKNVFKADVSSAYPFEGTKILPTLHDCKMVQGVAKPTKLYPFAFYIKSHHLAIYNEFDTHDWIDNKKYYTLYDEMFNDMKIDEDVTILCQASDYSLENTFHKIYNRKTQGDETAKLGMNAAIGFFQKNSNPKLSHLAAVIIARCCNRMIEIANKIKENKNNTVLFIATDSIVWKGDKGNYATHNKFIGSFTYEYENCDFYALGPKAYQIFNPLTKKCITKYAGMANGEEKDNIPFGKLPDLKGQTKYIINKDGHIQIIDWCVRKHG